MSSSAPRRHLALAISGTMVFLIGALGLLAGQHAGEQARSIHRADRLDLEKTLGGLTERYVLLGAQEVSDHLTGEDHNPQVWDPTAAEANTQRLRELVERTRTLDAGAILLDSQGQVLSAWSPTGEFPDPNDPGWTPLREAQAGLPLSNVMRSGELSVVALALPVPLSGGKKGALVGMWDIHRSGLQRYVADIDHGPQGVGSVLDAASNVVASADETSLGKPYAIPAVVEAGGSGLSQVIDSPHRGEPHVIMFAPAGRSGWSSVASQPSEQFEGALKRSTRNVELSLAALLLTAGSALVIMHRKRESVLTAISTQDELSGGLNRRGWFEWTERELDRAARANTSRHLMFVDLDGLKQINDVLGHAEGDRAIAACAQILRESASQGDMVGRLGGDEFVVLLSADTQPQEAIERVQRSVKAHNRVSDAPFELRLSAGCVRWDPRNRGSVDELVKRADAQMYKVKSANLTRSVGIIRTPQALGVVPEARNESSKSGHERSAHRP